MRFKILLAPRSADNSVVLYVVDAEDVPTDYIEVTVLRNGPPYRASLQAGDSMTLAFIPDPNEPNDGRLG